MRYAGLFAGWLLLASGVTPAWAADFAAELQWQRRVEIASPLSGVVTEVAVEAGEWVKKGQVLVRLEQRALRSQLSAKRVERKRLQLLFEEAQRELERSEELYDRTLLSDHDLQLARIEHAASESAMKALLAEITALEVQLGYANLTAPFDGIVLARYIEVGESVNSSLQPQPLLVVAQTGVMMAVTEVDAQTLQGLSLGQVLNVRLQGRRLSATVASLGWEPIAEGGDGYRLAVQVNLDEGELLPAGTPVTVIVP